MKSMIKEISELRAEVNVLTGVVSFLLKNYDGYESSRAISELKEELHFINERHGRNSSFSAPNPTSKE